MKGAADVTVQVQQILQAFELLPDGDKRELTVEILRRNLAADAPPLSDEQFVSAAEGIFLELDRNEAGNAG